MLPILSYREQITSFLDRCRSLIITAPPGTGKSTQIPQFLLDRATPQKRIVVLEPRRIAARSLAHRVAQESGCGVGETVGYQVRFEREVSETTRILFYTYGTFLQLLQSDPGAMFASVIVFDEFHERTLEADTALAWVRHICGSVRPDLRLLVLSATLDTGPLRRFLGHCGMIDVQEKSFPVEVRYQPPKPQEPLWQQVERAFGALASSLAGSALVFLPGVYEIDRAADALAVTCKRRGFRLLTLHGRLSPAAQQEALRAPEKEPCVVLSTNVAETSLTIPGVIAVIDSGFARMAAYDPQRDRNTLYLSRISLQNAAQRAGRAGRLGPGTCIRLWSRDDERAMPQAIVPEVLRLDLAGCALALGGYVTGLKKTATAVPLDLQWPTPPPAERWRKALGDLVRCGAIDRVAHDPASPVTQIRPLTALGEKIARLPVEPVIGRILLESRTRQELEMNIAMAALWEASEIRTGESHDLYAQAESFLGDPSGREWGREVRETFDQLDRLVRKEAAMRNPETRSGPDLRAWVSRSWMIAFSHRIAGKAGEGAVYELADGRSARLVEKKTVGGREALPVLVLALSIHEQAGRAQNRKVTVPLYLPLETGWIAQEFPDELLVKPECRWDEAKKRVVVEETVRFRSVVCGRREITDRAACRDEAAVLLADRLVAGEWDWREAETKAEQFLFRMRLVARACPELKLPKMDADDWALVYHGLCEGKRTLDEVRKDSVLRALREYLGQHLVGVVEKKAPETIMLPSGKKGRITYFDGAPPELSARLGDLIGYRDRFTLMDGRVPGVFDILAPNYRTVQKTADLGAFWKTVYPEIKNGLKRRYPKHPWP
ncbi:MAG: DEAD/DEAH box helicase [Chitinispirillaceae bacterium]|nr:DEAD/DEAH box helicase [Chitinispirillaceae bacterium]